jgi:SAM-dependent methyltransferase
MDSLRKLHNSSKRKLITQWIRPGSLVLDCGCGRGGDIHKWKLIQGVKVIGVDPDEESLAEAQTRTIEANFGMWFLPPGDVTTALSWGPYDVVCYNFSLHYIFENMDTYTKSVWAINQCLSPNGLLIGITPDKNRILPLLNSESKFEDGLGNKIELKGDKLLVNLVGGPFYAEGGREEPLLDPDMFIQSMIQSGMKLIKWGPMISHPNGLISDIYSQFVFVKQ